LDRSYSTNSKKPSTPISRQFATISSVDESLQDEDAWMSILAVANAEVSIAKKKMIKIEIFIFFLFSLMYSID